MDAACHRGKKRKYAANSKHAEHTGMPQRLYLRFLCAKRAVCSWVPEFAAYFRRAVPEVRGKSRWADQTQVLRLRDLRFCCRKSGCARRFPIFSRTSVKRGNTKRPVVKITTNSAGKHPLKRKIPPFGGSRGPSRTYHRKAYSQLEL